MTNIFADTFKNLSNNNTRESEYFPYQYSGLVEEDPNSFLNKLRTHFLQNNIASEGKKIKIARAQLQGEAREWFEETVECDCSFEEFALLFEQYFNSPERFSLAGAAFFGEAQGKLGGTRAFLNRKRKLLNRIEPGLPPTVAIRRMTQLLKSNLRQVMRVYTGNTVQDFIDKAVLIEMDLLEEEKQKAPKIPQTRTGEFSSEPTRSIIKREPNPVQSDANTNHPPTPCRFCRKWHFHSECPDNPYLRQNLNSNGAAGGQPPRLNAKPRPEN